MFGLPVVRARLIGCQEADQRTGVAEGVISPAMILSSMSLRRNWLTSSVEFTTLRHVVIDKGTGLDHGLCSSDIGRMDTRAHMIAQGENVSYWRLGDEVYRLIGSCSGFDLCTGFPMASRWECSYRHWQLYRSIYDFVHDVPLTQSS